MSNNLVLGHFLLRLILPPAPGLVLAVRRVTVAVLNELPCLARLLLQLCHMLVHFPMQRNSEFTGRQIKNRTDRQAIVCCSG